MNIENNELANDLTREKLKEGEYTFHLGVAPIAVSPVLKIEEINVSKRAVKLTLEIELECYQKFPHCPSDYGLDLEDFTIIGNTASSNDLAKRAPKVNFYYDEDTFLNISIPTKLRKVDHGIFFQQK